jgi:hypothetical protein
MRIRVIGAHLPRLDQKAIARFIADEVAEFRRGWLELRERGGTEKTEEEIEEDTMDLKAKLEVDLQTCALFEVEVTENDREFELTEFENTDRYCGWEPAFLSPDGERVVFKEGYAYTIPPELKDFRVAFYIHEWKEPDRLVGPTGELALPQFTSVPERLWKLAPYTPLT